MGQLLSLWKATCAGTIWLLKLVVLEHFTIPTSVFFPSSFPCEAQSGCSLVINHPALSRPHFCIASLSLLTAIGQSMCNVHPLKVSMGKVHAAGFTQFVWGSDTAPWSLLKGTWNLSSSPRKELFSTLKGRIEAAKSVTTGHHFGKRKSLLQLRTDPGEGNWVYRQFALKDFPKFSLNF